MSFQLEYAATNQFQTTDHYHFPLLQPNAIPYAYKLDYRPQKRGCTAANAPSFVDTSTAFHPQWQELGSAQTVNGNFPSHQIAEPAVEQTLERRPASVPPRGKSGRRRRCKPNPQDGPFIQESFAFPEQQTWLKVKPRHRRAGVDAETVKDTSLPSSEAPDDGEALCLDKHADRIAALMAQKRKENESRLFRERMSVQQRLHRGEQDDKDKIMAASHDELKRKMELSAKGVHEENAPDGTEPAFALVDPQEPSSPPGGHHFTADESLTADDESMEIVEDHYCPPTTVAVAQAQSESASDSSDVDDMVMRTNSHGQPESQHDALSNPSAYLQHNSIGHYSTAVTTQIFPAPIQTSASQQQQSMPFGQLAHLNQSQFSGLPSWHGVQEPVPRCWESQMWHALPSAPTPVSEMSISIQRIEQPAGIATRAAADNGCAGTTTGPYYADANPITSTRVSTTFTTSSTPHDDYLASEVDLAPPVLKSNMNMFTRQARESGVIGGNNVIGASTQPRRNMFDRS